MFPVWLKSSHMCSSPRCQSFRPMGGWANIKKGRKLFLHFTFMYKPPRITQNIHDDTAGQWFSYIQSDWRTRSSCMRHNKWRMSFLLLRYITYLFSSGTCWNWDIAFCLPSIINSSRGVLFACRCETSKVGIWVMFCGETRVRYGTLKYNMLCILIFLIYSV